MATFLRDQSLKTVSTLADVERDKPAEAAADTAFDMSTESGDLLAAIHKATWTGPIGF